MEGSLRVSVIIPNRNGGATLARCLAAALASRHPRFEVIVVDDDSRDDSLEIIRRFPCRLVQLPRHGGAAAARNAGAREARGEILFFTDSDCLLPADALLRACEGLDALGTNVALGGTYTPMPADALFCSRFQSVFVHYGETRKAAAPDYLATHALALRAETFHRCRGFDEGVRPILEDVELSHRLRGAGTRLALDPGLQVRHIFNHSLRRSFSNAFTKARHWTRYSLANHDLLADSGTASHGLKGNVAAHLASALLLLAAALTGQYALLAAVALVQAPNLWLNRGLLSAFRGAGGPGFAAAACAYYVLAYPVAVGVGAVVGATEHWTSAPARRAMPR
jgi:GT2 family glycosyltransferase